MTLYTKHGRVEIVAVEPVGLTTGHAIIAGKLTAIESPIYPAPPVDLRGMRNNRGNGFEPLTLREGARLLGCSPSDLSRLESGSHAPVDPEALKAIARAAWSWPAGLSIDLRRTSAGDR